MILKKIFASYAFRFMFGYVAALSLLVLAVLVTITLSYSHHYYSEAERSVEDELGVLEERYRRRGAEGVEALMAEREDRDSVYYYLVADAQRRKLAGNMPHWPEREHSDSWWRLQFEVSASWHDVSDDNLIISTRQLADGTRLLAARNWGDVVRIERLLRDMLIRSVVAMVVLGMLGGMVIAGLNVGYVDKVNRTAQGIMSGDLSNRIPVGKARGEFRELVQNLNKLLDRTQTLMAGIRQVSDNIAHDLRTPLTRLRNHLAALQGEVGPGCQERVQAMLEEADGLLATFNALLRIAQVESGNRRSDFSPVDVNVILQDVVELYEPLAAEKRITVAAELGPLPGLSGDRDLLFQAFANLLDNAIKYTPAGGSIRIDSEARDGGVQVRVADTGIGIPSDDLDKVFRRFYRVEASRSEQAGNGLGLSLVQAVVNLHRGSIALANRAPGLTVSVQLPVAAPA